MVSPRAMAWASYFASLLPAVAAILALSQRNFWNCSKACPPIGIQARSMASGSLVSIAACMRRSISASMLALQRRDVGQAHHLARLFRRHVHFDVHLHGISCAYFQRLFISQRPALKEAKANDACLAIRPPPGT